jgi:hypothetical protein
MPTSRETITRRHPSRRSVEHSDEHRTGQNVSIHGLPHVVAARPGLQIEHRIQSEQLKCVVMRRSRRCARPHEARLPHDIRCLHANARRRIRLHAFGQRRCVARNIENQPVSDVVHRLPRVRVRIVYEQDEALRARWRVGPRKRRRSHVLKTYRTGIFLGIGTEVSKRRRSQLQRWPWRGSATLPARPAATGTSPRRWALLCHCWNQADRQQKYQSGKPFHPCHSHSVFLPLSFENVLESVSKAQPRSARIVPPRDSAAQSIRLVYGRLPAPARFIFRPLQRICSPARRRASFPS